MKMAVTGTLFCIFSFFLFSCGESGGVSDGNTRSDSLFLGIRLGMEREAFYNYCWEQNKKKVFTHGPTNQSVEYKLMNELDEPVSMRFYPTFHEDKIFEMPVTFTYDAWAPWNERYGADSLFVRILPVFKKWYGEDFKKIKHPTMGDVYYRIDGKRRINLFKKDDQVVQAVFTDLKVEKQLKEAYAKRLEAELGIKP
jgi:hypothetical protein